MAQVKHKKTLSIPDGPDTSIVRPTDWNDTHDISGLATTDDTALLAPIASPVFTGIPTTPTPAPPHTNDQTIPNTSYLTTNYAPLASPTLTGTPRAITVTPATDSSTKIATTAFVASAISNLTTTGLAPLADPIFTGDPRAPTPAAADNDTSIATTAFVKTAVLGATGVDLSAYATKASPALTGVPTAPTPTSPHTNDTTIATSAFVTAAVAGLAPLASPTFTGHPKGITEATSDNTTNLATTEYVTTKLGSLSGSTFDSPTLTNTSNLPANLPKSVTPAATGVGSADSSIATTAFVSRDYLSKANNLSGITVPATARTNLGLGNAATLNAGGRLSGTLPYWDFLGNTVGYNIGNTNDTVPVWQYVTGLVSGYLPLGGGTVSSLTVSPGGLAVNGNILTNNAVFAPGGLINSPGQGGGVSVQGSVTTASHLEAGGRVMAGGGWYVASDTFYPRSSIGANQIGWDGVGWVAYGAYMASGGNLVSPVHDYQLSPQGQYYAVLEGGPRVHFVNLNVFVDGDIGASSKSFHITHPSKPNMVLSHGSLEGPEYATYYRGKGTVDSLSAATIALPDYFTSLCDESTATIQLTPILSAQGATVPLATSLVVQGKFSVTALAEVNAQEFFWLVQAVRKDIPALEVERVGPPPTDVDDSKLEEHKREVNRRHAKAETERKRVEKEHAERSEGLSAAAGERSEPPGQASVEVAL